MTLRLLQMYVGIAEHESVMSLRVNFQNQSNAVIMAGRMI